MEHRGGMGLHSYQALYSHSIPIECINGSWQTMPAVLAKLLTVDILKRCQYSDEFQCFDHSMVKGPCVYNLHVIGM